MNEYHATDHDLVPRQLGDEQAAKMLAKQQDLQAGSDDPLWIGHEGSVIITAKRALPQLTALGARSTEAVIAELKQKPQTPLSLHSPSSKLISIGPLPSLSSISSNGPSASNVNDGEDDEGPNEDPDEDDTDEDDQPKGRSRKTERQRRQNAIADSYLQDALHNPTKKHKLVPQDEANQSTRYIVHQAESQRIISTPREYQIELFERAKAKNIIAVLDTGEHCLLLLHFVR